MNCDSFGHVWFDPTGGMPCKCGVQKFGKMTSIQPGPWLTLADHKRKYVTVVHADQLRKYAAGEVELPADLVRLVVGLYADLQYGA